MQHFAQFSFSGVELAIKHFDFPKMAGLWLASEVVGHVGIHRSKALEVSRRSNVGLVAKPFVKFYKMVLFTIIIASFRIKTCFCLAQ